MNRNCQIQCRWDWDKNENQYKLIFRFIPKNYSYVRPSFDKNWLLKVKNKILNLKQKTSKTLYDAIFDLGFTEGYLTAFDGIFNHLMNIQYMPRVDEEACIRIIEEITFDMNYKWSNLKKRDFGALVGDKWYSIWDIYHSDWFKLERK
jgi:hypothetical protein